jgi:hypothetical protein
MPALPAARPRLREHWVKAWTSGLRSRGDRRRMHRSTASLAAVESQNPWADAPAPLHTPTHPVGAFLAGSIDALSDEGPLGDRGEGGRKAGTGSGKVEEEEKDAGGWGSSSSNKLRNKTLPPSMLRFSLFTLLSLLSSLCLAPDNWNLQGWTWLA